MHTTFWYITTLMYISYINECTFCYIGKEDEWRQQRLDNKTQLPPNVPAPNLDITRLIHYRIARGLCVEISAAYGLPGRSTYNLHLAIVSNI